MLRTGVLLCVLFVCLTKGQSSLDVVGREFRLNGQKIFLSGMNIAWHAFGDDFGNGRYDCCTGNALENYLRRIRQNGGNSVRIWLHCDGRRTPQFDNDGYAIQSDRNRTLAGDLGKFLDKAREYDILVFIVLWNGAVKPPAFLNHLFWDQSKLTRYINNVLRPLVRSLKTKQALGGWDIINEPEALVYAGRSDTNPCFDTRPLAGTGAGWTRDFIPMNLIQRFINWQIDGIKAEDDKALATVGSWSELAQTNSFGARDYYTDTCLRAAGGRTRGTIDFYQMHTYATRPGNQFNPSSPLKVSYNSVFNLNKPNVIGELSQDGGDGRSLTQYMFHAYCRGFSGAWTWQANGGGPHADSFTTQANALKVLERYQQFLSFFCRGGGGKIRFNFTP